MNNDDIIHNKHLLSTACVVFVIGRHLQIAIILITQNIFINYKYFRTIPLNSSHIVRTRDQNESNFLKEI